MTDIRDWLSLVPKTIENYSAVSLDAANWAELCSAELYLDWV